MIALTLDGAASGAVLFLLICRLAPPKRSTLVTLARFDAHLSATAQTPRPAVTVPRRTGLSPWSWQRQVGSRLADLLLAQGITHTSLRRDLALTGRSYDLVMGRKVVAFTAGFLLSILAVSSLSLIAGVGLPAGSPVVLALVFGGACFFLPDLEARAEATNRRIDFRQALGAYLDLVALEMAGSAAPAEALPSAAKVGAGWPMALLRDTLYRASTSGTDQWAALAELGERIAVPELRDLGALVKLVGQDGAQVRETLTARAATMRRTDLSEAQGRASERDQSMQMAQLVVGFGFILFIAYPAVVAVTAIA
jgi:tight adherence protein C